MTRRRVVTTAVAVSSSALMAGALGVGTAAAATSGTSGGTTNPLGGTLSGVTSTVNSTTHAVKQAVKHATRHSKNDKKAGTADGGSGLPKPVKKLVNETEKTVGTVRRTVDDAVKQITGSGGGSGSGTKPSHHKTPGGSATGAHSGAAHHRAAAHRHGNAASHRHRQKVTAGGAGSVRFPSLTHVGMAPIEMPSMPSGHAPSLAAPVGKHPAVAGQAPAGGLGHDLLHPTAVVPAPIVHDGTLALELQLIAAALAGAVAAGHLAFAKRRLFTTRVVSRSAGTATPDVAPTATADAPAAAAPAAGSRRPGITRPGPALG
jgi:hypothetical protein